MTTDGRRSSSALVAPESRLQAVFDKGCIVMQF